MQGNHTETMVVEAVHPHWFGQLALEKRGNALLHLKHGHEGTYLLDQGRLVVTWKTFPQETFYLHNGRFVHDSLQSTDEQKRYIRLKEYPPLSSLRFTPTDGYMAHVDGTLTQEAYLIETDENGFIKTGNPAIEQGQTIVVLGDSVVENLYCVPDLRFCAHLERLMRNDHNIPVNVLNGGYSGATTLHCFNTFMNKVIPLRPACVILLTGIVDVWACNLRNTFWNNDMWFEPLVDINCANRWSDNSHLNEINLSDRLGLLLAFHHAAAAFGVPLLYATVAHRQEYAGEYIQKTSCDKTTFERDLSLRRKVNEITRTASSATSRPLTDLERILSNRSDIFYDMFHLNCRGNKAVAAALADGDLTRLFSETVGPTS